MSIEKIIKSELQLEDNFDYHKLYNDGRGAIHKDEYKALLKYCIKENIINVKKYLIEENINSDIFHDIVDKNSEGQYQLKEALKEYHQESHYLVAPFVYLLEMVEPKYKINEKRTQYEETLLEFPDNIEVGHRFERSNAFVRLYFKDSEISINSSNDSIENLVDTLELVDSTLYILYVDEFIYRKRDIVIYKLTKKYNFNELKYKAQHKFLDEIEKYKL